MESDRLINWLVEYPRANEIDLAFPAQIIQRIVADALNLAIKGKDADAMHILHISGRSNALIIHYVMRTHVGIENELKVNSFIEKYTQSKLSKDVSFEYCIYQGTTFSVVINPTK